MALRHLPSGYQAVNRTWMWAALFATNISVWVQSLGRTDTDGRAHGKRLRRELINLVARVIHHGRRIVLRFTPGTGNPSTATDESRLPWVDGPRADHRLPAP
jgi:hypothetical protein